MSPHLILKFTFEAALSVTKMDVINQIIDSLTGFVGWDTKYTIDGPVFNLHCKVTTIILLVFSAIISAGQFIGDPIDCVVEDFDNLASIMDTYCWIHSTFTLPRMVLNKENEEGTYMYIVDIKVRNLKIGFDTGGTWHRVKQ